MIITIIITAIVSVILTLVIGYFIWSGIGVRKLKKEVKNNNKLIINNKLYIDDIIQHSDDIHKKVNDDKDELNNTINSLFKRLDDTNTDWNRELDKRFNNVYQKIEENHS